MEIQLKDFDFKKSKLKEGIVYIDYLINFKANGGVRHPKISDEINSLSTSILLSEKVLFSSIFG